MELLGSMATFMREGGTFMIPILGVATLAAAIAAERAIVIFRAAAVDNHRLIERVGAAVRRGQLGEVRALAGRSSNPLLAVTRALIDRSSAGAAPGVGVAEGELLETCDATASMAMAPLHHRLGYLAMLANIATLLGLLGTIFGLMHAFQAVGQADPAQRSAFLAAGISQALNTTAFGLIVAIPTMAIHSFLLAQVDGLADRVESAAHQLVRLLAGGDGAQGGGAAGLRSELHIREGGRAATAIR